MPVSPLKPLFLSDLRGIEKKIKQIRVPQAIRDALHPVVRRWVATHKDAQKEREQERELEADEFWLAQLPLRDLTVRDLYRFRISNAIFEGVELAGGRIGAAPINGKVTFVAEGREIQCSIVEKMQGSLKPDEARELWTAYPDHHRHGLTSTGYLRVKIDTYIGGPRPEWVETERVKMEDLLPEIVGTIVAAGAELARWEQENQNRMRQHREEQDLLLRSRREMALEEQRWQAFRAHAGNWQERARLLHFLDELQRRLAQEGDTMVDGRPLSSWIEWAQARTELYDPLRDGAAGLFRMLSSPDRKIES